MILKLGIPLIIAVSFQFGLWILCGNEIGRLFSDFLMKRHYRRLSQGRHSPKKTMLPLRHLQRLLSVVGKGREREGAYGILLGTAMLFSASLAVFARMGSVLGSLALSSAIALLPYALLRVRLKAIRIESSYEGIELITGLINNYRQSELNMLEALEQSACKAVEGSFSKKHLFRLSTILRAYKNEDELDEAVSSFVYAFDTEWSALIGMNIKMGVLDGTDVRPGLDDILTKLEGISETIEEEKRNNNESFSMIRFILVPLYLAGVYMAVQAFGFTLTKYFSYQFNTSLGLFWGSLSIGGMMLCFVILSLARKPKFDF